MTTHPRLAHLLILAALVFGVSGSAGAAEFSIARIYIEYNSSPRDLGYHVSLDGEDWRSLKIVNPKGKTIFEVAGKAAYKDLGMTELFFEGAEPPLDEVPLNELLALFPEGRYQFIGTTVEGKRISRDATLSHAIPDGPIISSEIENDTLVIRWLPVTHPPNGFPLRNIEIVGYQVIVGQLLVTLPGTATSLTIPAEFYRSLQAGVQPYEVLAIDASGNQTITEGTFNKTTEAGNEE